MQPLGKTVRIGWTRGQTIWSGRSLGPFDTRLDCWDDSVWPTRRASCGILLWKNSDMNMRTTVLGTILFSGIVSLAGCATDPEDVSYKSISRNLTPELQGVTERGIDIDRNMAVTSNQNLRMMWGELGRMWLFDKPSRLSPYDIIATSGQPGQ